MFAAVVRELFGRLIRPNHMGWGDESEAGSPSIADQPGFSRTYFRNVLRAEVMRHFRRRPRVPFWPLDPGHDFQLGSATYGSLVRLWR